MLDGPSVPIAGNALMDDEFIDLDDDEPVPMVIDSTSHSIDPTINDPQNILVPLSLVTGAAIRRENRSRANGAMRLTENELFTKVLRELRDFSDPLLRTESDTCKLRIAHTLWNRREFAMMTCKNSNQERHQLYVGLLWQSSVTPRRAI